MDLGLKGKKAIVTGGSKGIGLAAALTLASEGAKVAIVARDRDDLKAAAQLIEERTGTAPLWISADVSLKREAEKAVETAVSGLGGLDILVNNAGTSAARPFDEVERRTGRRIWILNFSRPPIFPRRLCLIFVKPREAAR